MCARFIFRSPASEVDLLLHATTAPQKPRYNIAPTDMILAVDMSHEADMFRWGLIPSWAKSPDVGVRAINARAETLHERGTFQSALAHRRCAIPASGFYEWAEIEIPSASQASLFDDGPTERVKQPYLFEVDRGRAFAFAGLWDAWSDQASGHMIRSCTIITTGPNELLGRMHDRMPCILREEDIDRWLDPRVEDIGSMLVPFPAERMSARKVSRRINRPGVEGEDLLNP